MRTLMYGNIFLFCSRSTFPIKADRRQIIMVEYKAIKFSIVAFFYDSDEIYRIHRLFIYRTVEVISHTKKCIVTFVSLTCDGHFIGVFVFLNIKFGFSSRHPNKFPIVICFINHFFTTLYCGVFDGTFMLKVMKITVCAIYK